MLEKQLGEKVKAARLAQGMNMVELAGKCGLTKGFISQLESGTSNPSLNTLRKIGSALNVPVSELLGRADSRQPGERVATGTIRPTILHEAFETAEQSGIVPLSSGPEGTHSLVTVTDGSRLVHRRTLDDDPNHGTALLTVLSGSIQVLQGQEKLELTRGSIASWDAGADYTIEAAGRTGANLVLFTPSGCSLPVYQELRGSIQRKKTLRPSSPVPVESGIVPDRRRGIPVRIQGRVPDAARTTKADGSLRLVAMRAQRLAARRGQS